MRVEWHVPIAMDDGNVLDADVFRPDDDGTYPVIMSYGIYGKGLLFSDEIYAMPVAQAGREGPLGPGGVDERVPGVGGDRPGTVGARRLRRDPCGLPRLGMVAGVHGSRSLREIADYAQCIEWAGTQPWSNGKVGLLGISYYAVTQWRVAQMAPKHLAAMIPWEGYLDYYRGPTHHGGIRSEFQDRWWSTQVARVQYGVGERSLTQPPHR